MEPEVKPPFSYKAAALKGQKIENPEMSALAKSILEGGYKLVIIRGIPGSGKTYLANQLKKELGEAVICEADNFMGPKFDLKRLNDCHQQCQNLARLSLKQGKIAIVSNTSTTLGEMEIYRKIVIEEGLTEEQIKIMEPLTPWKYDIDQCFKKCTHKTIPKSILEKHMKNMTFIPTNPDLLVLMRGAQLR